MIDRIRRSADRLPAWALAAALLWLLIGAMPVAAREPYREFLDGLRMRGFHDTALAYIDRLEAGDELSAATAQTLDFERAVTLEMASVAARAAAEKAELLDRAVSLFREFLQQYPDNTLATAARFRLGAVLVTRAQLLTDGLPPQDSAPPADERARRARAMYDEAREIYASLQQWVREKLLAMPAHLDPVSNAGLINERARLRSRYVEVQLLRTGILQKKAETHPIGSPDYRDGLHQAAAEYNGLFAKYAPRLAGYYARLYEGRCQQQAGDLDAALAIYEELLELSTAATPFFDLKTNALKAALECWMDDSRRSCDFAVQHGEIWLKDARPVQLENDTAISVIKQLAIACRALADAPGADVDAATRYRLRAEQLDHQASDVQRALTSAETGDLPNQEANAPADERSE